MCIFVAHLNIHCVGTLSWCFEREAVPDAKATFTLMGNKLEKCMKSREQRKQLFIEKQVCSSHRAGQSHTVSLCPHDVLSVRYNLRDPVSGPGSRSNGTRI